MVAGKAVAQLFVALGLKSTLAKDIGDQVDGEMKGLGTLVKKHSLEIGAAMTGIGIAAKLMADDINQSYVSFDDAIAQVESLGGVTEEQMAQIAANSISMSKEMPIAASKVAEGYYAMRSAGYSANAAIAEMPAIAKLAVAGNLEMADAVNTTTMVLDVYGDRAGDAAVISNVLLGTVQGFKTTLPELQQSLSKSADAANTLGIGFTELSALSGMLRKNFTSAEEAGTGLKSFLLRLSDTNTQAYLESLGVSVKDAQGNFVGLQSVLDQLDDALERSGGEVNQMSILNKAFGAESVRTALSLVKQKDELEGYTKALEEGRAIDEAYEAQVKSTGAQLEIATNKMEAAKISLGDAMAPATIAAAGAMASLAGIIEGIPEPLQAIAGTGLIASQSLIAIGPAIAGIVPAIELYKGSTLAATAATRGFSAALLASPAGAAALGLSVLAGSLLVLHAAASRGEDAVTRLNSVMGDSGATASMTSAEIRDLADEYTGMATESNVAFEFMVASMADAVLKTHDYRAATIAASGQVIGAHLNEVATAKEMGDAVDAAMRKADAAYYRSKSSVDGLSASYDELKTAIDRALSIGDEIEDQGRDVERADIRKTRAAKDLEKANLAVTEAEKALQAARISGESNKDQMAALEDTLEEARLRQREAVLTVADAEDDYQAAVTKSGELVEEQSSLLERFGEETIAAAQERLKVMQETLTTETANLKTAQEEREALQLLHLERMVDLDANADADIVANWTATKDWIEANPIIAKKYNIEISSSGIPPSDFYSPDFAEKTVAWHRAKASETIPDPDTGEPIPTPDALSSRYWLERNVDEKGKWAGPATKFAEGGIVTQPTVGLVGEAGPEAIIPLRKMDETLGQPQQVSITVHQTNISPKPLDAKEIRRQTVRAARRLGDEFARRGVGA